MSVRTRIDDAKVLWVAGRKDGAFTFILLAFAATARKRHPKYVAGMTRNEAKDHRPLPGEHAHDHIAFKTLALDYMDKITGGPKYNVSLPINGRNVPVEEILYEHLRNFYVHECVKPSTIEFTEPEIYDDESVNVIRCGATLGFPEVWIWNMALVVVEAEVNKPLFDDFEMNDPPKPVPHN